jgi:hypothetical protein
MGQPGTGAHHEIHKYKRYFMPVRAKGVNFSVHLKHLIFNQMSNALNELHHYFFSNNLILYGRNTASVVTSPEELNRISAQRLWQQNAARSVSSDNNRRQKEFRLLESRGSNSF